MADDVDEFVLRYRVESDKAEKNLERLQSSVKNTSTAMGNATENVKRFAEGSVQELSKVVPELNGITTAVSAMSGEFAIAAAGLAVLAAAVKSFMNTREQYNKQRLQAMDLGIGSIQLEELQRQGMRKSQGNISREQVAEQLKILSDRQKSGYRDLTRMGPEAQGFWRAGVDIGKIGEGMRSFDKVINDLGVSLSKMKPEDVAAAAQILGITQDYATLLAQQGQITGQLTSMTADEVLQRKQAEEELTKFNNALNNLKDHFNNAENAVGQKLIPIFTVLVEWIDKVVAAVPDWMKDVSEYNKQLEQQHPDAKSWMDYVPGAKMYHYAYDRGKKFLFGDESGMAPSRTTPGEKSEDQKKQEAKKYIDAQTAASAANVKAANDMQLAVNMFSGAVSSFSNALDERQAWAAWAGEVGRASGLGSAPLGATAYSGISQAQVMANSGLAGIVASPGSSSGIRAALGKMFGGKGPQDDVPVPSEIKGIIDEYATKYNLDPTLIKKLIYTESRFKSNAQSEAGAQGLGQLMPQIQKAYGITNPFDVRQNIYGTTRLLRENIDRAGGDVNKALLYYHGGTDQRNWGPKTMAYPGKVFSAPIEIMDNAAKQQIPGMVTEPYQNPLIIPGQAESERRQGYPQKDLPAPSPYTNTPGIINRVPQRSEGRAIQMSYPGAKTGSGVNLSASESKESIQYQQVASSIAQVLQVMPNQVMQKRVTSGDYDFAYRNLLLETKLSLEASKGAMMNMRLGFNERDAARRQSNQIAANLAMLETYGPSIGETMPKGPQQLTLGKVDIAIAVNGAKDPHATAQAVQQELGAGLVEVVNSAASGIKY